MNTGLSKELLEFIKNSPTAFHTVHEIRRELEENGFSELREQERWTLKPGGAYYVVRNETSIAAFRIGTRKKDYAFKIAASHSDFPSFKLKEKAELSVRGSYVQLNTEGYGGMICSTWFDRPLSVAGRVIVKTEGGLQTRLVNLDRDLLIIPSLAIHMNRQVNDGVAFNKQVDTLPLYGAGQTAIGDFDAMLARELGVTPEDICGKDLFVYNRMAGCIWGEKDEFLSAPHLDDTECAFAALKGFLKGYDEQSVNVYACFDNEEVGSQSKQGAGSTFLREVLRRITLGLGGDEEDYFRAVSAGFLVSADNAHAVHPNHPEKTDAENCAYMNKGIVIKSHAGQKYTSDAVSSAIFRQVCELAGVPVQYFSNRSDAAGGSTLGNILMSQVSMNAVDIGLPQLAMHSAYETAGTQDLSDLVKAMQMFYQCRIETKDGKLSVTE